MPPIIPDNSNPSQAKAPITPLPDLNTLLYDHKMKRCALQTAACFPYHKRTVEIEKTACYSSLSAAMQPPPLLRPQRRPGLHEVGEADALGQAAVEDGFDDVGGQQGQA